MRDAGPFNYRKINTMSRLSDLLTKTVQYVFEEHLAVPYKDVDLFRGQYLDESNKIVPYGNNIAYAKNEKRVYRPNHGLAHTLRVVCAVDDIIALLTTTKNEAIRTVFTEIQQNKALVEKIKIAAAFYVAGRESEERFENPRYQLYRKKSSEYFSAYIDLLQTQQHDTNFFNKLEIQQLAAVLTFTHIEANDAYTIFTTTVHALPKQAAAIKIILYFSHLIDLSRCADADRMNAFKDSMCILLDHEKIAEVFQKHEIRQMLSGQKCKCTFDEDDLIFKNVVLHPKTQLFKHAGINPEIAILLISAMANNIFSLKDASAVSNELECHALQRAPNDFKQWLLSVLQISDIADRLRDNIYNREAYLFKVIRADKEDYWDDFVRSLVDPKKYRPELRHGERLNHTIRFDPVRGHQIVPTDKKQKKPLLPTGIKEQYTRQQSTTLAVFGDGFIPGWFGQDSDDYNRHELAVGIIFPAKDCPPHLISQYDRGTVNRPYDATTREEAVNFLKQQIQNEIYHNSLRALQAAGINTYVKNGVTYRSYNEVLAHLKWTPKVAITIFSDNLNSRLLAILRARDLSHRLAQHYLDSTIHVPIRFYPNLYDNKKPIGTQLTEYSLDEQNNDLDDAKRNFRSLDYLIAIYVQTNQHAQLENISYDISPLHIDSAYRILNKCNSERFKSVQDIIRIFSDKAYQMLMNTKLAWFTQKIIWAVANAQSDEEVLEQMRLMRAFSRTQDLDNCLLLQILNDPHENIDSIFHCNNLHINTFYMHFFESIKGVPAGANDHNKWKYLFRNLTYSGPDLSTCGTCCTCHNTIYMNESLKCYINEFAKRNDAETIANVFAKNTLLGELVDYHVNPRCTHDTNRRKMVNTWIAQKQTSVHAGLFAQRPIAQQSIMPASQAAAAP